MVVNAFEAVLQELGDAIGIPLKPGKMDGCLVRYPEGLEVQIQMNTKRNHILLYADLGAVPPGRYREDLLREALRANGKPYPRKGVLAFTDAKDHLIIYLSRSMTELTGEKIAYIYKPFVEKAQKWQDALTRGEIPAVRSDTSTGTPPGLFGMRP